jgi:hypothetical protein
MSQWNGVQVWQGHNGHFQNVTATWAWSGDPHQHYEVLSLANGSYWVPVSTHPPASWGGSTQVVGTIPLGNQPVNPNGTEFRPDTTYIWIPNASIPGNLVPGQTTNRVVCGQPSQYPPPAMDIHLSLLNEVLTSDKSDQKAFRFFWTCGETEGVANSFLGKMHPEALLDKDLITHQVCL